MVLFSHISYLIRGSIRLNGNITYAHHRADSDDMYSSDQKKVPVFIPYYGRATVHRLNLNGEKTVPRDPYYARSTRVLRPYRFCY